MKAKTMVQICGLSLMTVLIAACAESPEEGTSPENVNESVDSQNNDGNDSEASSDTESEGNRHGGELVLSDLTEGESLDPHTVTQASSMRYIENMYSTLLRYKDGDYGEVEGDLAHDYKVSEDGMMYEFHLHDNAVFHNGDPVTSMDVKYSVERIIEKGTRAAQFAAVEDIETPDDHTVIFHMSEPVTPFLTFLAYPMNAIVNQTVVEENDGSLDNADAGSGPFALVERVPAQEMVLERFDDYFIEDLPYLDRLIWRAIPDDTSRTTALRNGEIDLVLQVAPRDIQLLEQDEDLVIESVTGTFWEYLGINTDVAPFDDERVRQAIAWAIDREDINDAVKFGEATVLTNGPIPPGHWAFNDEDVYPEQDLAQARELLADAGYEDGFETSIRVNSASGEQIDAAQIIRQQLAEIGIDAEVETQESSIFFDGLGTGDFEMSVVGWVGFVDPDEYLYEIFHTEGMYNQQAYSNAELDAILEEARQEVDQDVRRDLYLEAQTIIAQEAPMAFLYANAQTSAMSHRVQGFDVNPTVSSISLRDTWIED